MTGTAYIRIIKDTSLSIKTTTRPPKRGIAFFDLDGTLLDNRANTIPESTRRALDLLRPNYYVILSTGRDMDTHYSVRYKGMVQPDAIIHQNGSKLTIGDELLFEHTVDRELLREIYEFCSERGLCIGTSIGAEDFFINPARKAASDRAFLKAVRRNFVPFEEIFERDIRVTALSYAGDLQAEKEIIEKRFPMLELFAFNGGTGADVVERGFSKAEGMRTMCRHFGIDPADTYAFGDSPNDAALLRAAGIGIAMGNADEEVKAIADYVTDDVSSDGIYNACVHFGLI